MRTYNIQYSEKFDVISKSVLDLYFVLWKGGGGTKNTQTHNEVDGKRGIDGHIMKLLLLNFYVQNRLRMFVKLIMKHFVNRALLN